MPALTDSIMAAVPVEDAGVGSAVNDVSRELGSALGIAVLGSITNATYRDEFDDAMLEPLPDEAADIVGESIGGAIAVADQAPVPALGDALVEEASDAFTTAFHTSLTSAAVLAAVVGAVVFVAGRRYRPAPPADAQAPDTADSVA